MLPILQIGPLAVQTPGLIILLGLWLGLLLSEKFCPRRGILQHHLYNLVFTGLIFGIIGGRLIYFLRFPDAFLRSPISIISINPGLFLLEDGVLLGLLAMLVYAYRKHMRIRETLDVLTPCLAVLAVAIGFSHIASGAAFGAETSLPWGIHLWGALRHPTQIIETISAIAILALLWPGRKVLDNWPAGLYFINFICLSSISRLFQEAFRADSLVIFGGIRVSQVVAWIVLIGALLVRRHLLIRDNSSPIEIT